MRIIQANIDRTAFVVFAVLLLLMVGIYGYEITRPEPEYITATKTKIQRELPNDQYEKCVKYIQGDTELEEAEQLRRIRDFNIFDYKYVRDREELEKAADKKYERAEQLYENGELEEAKKILEGILLSWPTHIRSKELLEKIQQAQATPTPSPTPKRRAPENMPPGMAPGMPGMPGT